MDFWRDHYQVIKSFIILAVLRRSAYRVCEAHLCIFAPGQHSSFRRNFAAVAGSWQHCVRFELPEIWTSCSRDETRYRLTNWPFLIIILLVFQGLVYVKCGSCAGAGRAFRSLHGAWFDGRLVTVKFIKLHRFHTRYPDSVNLNTPFKRSSLKPVSTFVTPDESISSGFLTSTPLKST